MVGGLDSLVFPFPFERVCLGVGDSVDVLLLDLNLFSRLTNLASCCLLKPEENSFCLMSYSR